MFSGYLKPVRRVDDEKWELSVPNREVHLSCRELVKRWFASKVEENQLEEMLRGLTSGDVELFDKLVESAKDDACEQVLEDALKQIGDRGYASEPSASGIADILEIAVAFRGKELWVRHRNRE